MFCMYCNNSMSLYICVGQCSYRELYLYILHRAILLYIYNVLRGSELTKIQICFTQVNSHSKETFT